MERKVIEFLFPIFEDIGRLPALIKLVAFGALAALTVFFYKKHTEREEELKHRRKKKTHSALSFPVYFTIFIFILMGLRIYVFGGAKYSFMTVQVKPFDDSFVYGDLSTWDPGLKVLIICMFISLALSVLQSLAGGWYSFLTFVSLNLSWVFLSDLALTYAEPLLFGLFEIIPITFLYVGALVAPTMLLSNFCPDVDYSKRTGPDPYWSRYGNNSGNNSGSSTSSYSSSHNVLLNLPAMIRDEYGNVYTRQYVSIDEGYAEYYGAYTMVTIYAENVKRFSATGDGHYFTW